MVRYKIYTGNRDLLFVYSSAEKHQDAFPAASLGKDTRKALREVLVHENTLLALYTGMNGRAEAESALVQIVQNVAFRVASVVSNKQLMEAARRAGK